MKRLVAIVAVIATGGIVTSSAGAGAVQKFDTELTAEYFCGNGFCNVSEGTDWVFSGTIDSPRRACRVGRRVDVYAKEPGADTLLGYGFSDSNRRWNVTTPFETSSEDRYYGRAPKLKLSSGKICKVAQSNDFID